MVTEIWGKWLPVALGGAIGSLIRVLVQSLLSAWSTQFPWGTFACNSFGSFAIGLLAAGLAPLPSDSPWRLLLMAGLLGGFTTFSSFSLENLNLIRQGQIKLALLYAFGSLAIGVLAAAFGFLLYKNFIRSVI